MDVRCCSVLCICVYAECSVWINHSHPPDIEYHLTKVKVFGCVSYSGDWIMLVSIWMCWFIQGQHSAFSSFVMLRLSQWIRLGCTTSTTCFRPLETKTILQGPTKLVSSLDMLYVLTSILWFQRCFNVSRFTTNMVEVYRSTWQSFRRVLRSIESEHPTWQESVWCNVYLDNRL